jgi:hypothetical protein
MVVVVSRDEVGESRRVMVFGGARAQLRGRYRYRQEHQTPVPSSHSLDVAATVTTLTFANEKICVSTVDASLD